LCARVEDPTSQGVRGGWHAGQMDRQGAFGTKRPPQIGHTRADVKMNAPAKVRARSGFARTVTGSVSAYNSNDPSSTEARAVTACAKSCEGSTDPDAAELTYLQLQGGRWAVRALSSCGFPALGKAREESGETPTYF